MKHIIFKGSKSSGAGEIASLLAKQYLKYFPEDATLIFRDSKKINLDNKEVVDFIPMWDEYISESIENLEYVDFLDLCFDEKSLEISKQAYYASLEKLFKTYKLVLIVSNSFMMKDLLGEENIAVVLEPTKESIDHVSDLTLSQHSFLILNKFSSSVSSSIRDKIAEIDLKMIARIDLENKEDAQLEHNLLHILQSFDIVKFE